MFAERPVINFASGLPDPACFPATALREAAGEILAEDWRGGLQYGEAEGYRRSGPSPRTGTAWTPTPRLRWPCRPVGHHNEHVYLKYLGLRRHRLQDLHARGIL